jgi:outer membrane protein OmpA-like peptidoglycan-associated protein
MDKGNQMANYKKISGKSYDKNLLEIADKSVSGRGDGRISLEDAKNLFSAVKEDGTYSDIEKATMEYIRDNYKFTASADKWFRTEIRKWAAQKKKKLPKSTTVSKTTLVAAKAKRPVAFAEDSSEKNLDTISLLPLDPPKIQEGTQEHEFTYPKIPAVDMKTMDPDKKKVFWVIGVFLVLFILLIFILFRYGCSSPQEPVGSQSSNPIEKKPIAATNKPKLLSVEEIEKLKFSFKIGNVELSTETKESLKLLSESLKEDPKLKLKIIGHSCDIGTTEKNQRYSLQRAEKVQKFLISLGVPEDRLFVEGKGESEPIEEGDTEEARSKNRRVEFKIVK